MKKVGKLVVTLLIVLVVVAITAVIWIDVLAKKVFQAPPKRDMRSVARVPNAT